MVPVVIIIHYQQLQSVVLRNRLSADKQRPGQIRDPTFGNKLEYLHPLGFAEKYGILYYWADRRVKMCDSNEFELVKMTLSRLN